MQWVEISQSQGELPKDASFVHEIHLTTHNASKPICLRCLGIASQDTIQIQLQHSSQQPMTIDANVDTFLDLWIDPFEFDCQLLDLDTLPAPLTVIIKWKTESCNTSVWTPYQNESDWKCIAQQKHQMQEVPTIEISPLEDTIARLAEEKQVSEPQMAFVSLLACMFRVILQDPSRLVQTTCHVENASNVTAATKDINAITDTVKDVKEIHPAGLFLVNAVKYWPAFKDSRILSWIATVINACIRDVNDMNDSSIPEDLDIPELVACWCPPPPWKKRPSPGIECIDTIHGYIDTMLEQESRRTDWRNSLWLAAFAMCCPEQTAVLPLKQKMHVDNAILYGSIVRNFCYSFVYTRIGTDPFALISVDTRKLKEIIQWLMNLNYLYQENKIEFLIKKFVLILIDQIHK